MYRERSAAATLRASPPLPPAFSNAQASQARGGVCSLTPAGQDYAGAGRALGRCLAPGSSRGSGTKGCRDSGRWERKPLRGGEDAQYGDSEQEDLDPNPPGLQESPPKRSLVGGPEQEKDFGPASAATADVRAFRGRLYRPHRDGELSVSGRRPCGGGGGEWARGSGAHAECVCVGGWIRVPGLWVWP